MKIACNHCGQHIAIREADFGTTVGCPTCQHPITISGESLIPEEKSADAQSVGWLHEIEILLRKMLVGVVRFIFRVLPRMIRHLVIFVFPWSLRLIRIVAILAVWLGLVFWPWIVVSWVPKQFPSVQMPAFLNEKPLIEFGVWGWIVLALVGSGWGLVHVSIKRRRQKLPPPFPQPE